MRETFFRMSAIACSSCWSHGIDRQLSPDMLTFGNIE